MDVEFLEKELLNAELAAILAAKASDKPDVPTLETGKAYHKIYKYIIYLVPAFSNPSAKTLPLEIRKELVLLARKYDALIVSHDVYDFLLARRSLLFA